MITIEPLAVKVGTKLAMSLATKGTKYFLSSPYNDYEKEIINITNETIKKYKELYATPSNGKVHFIDSKIVTTELLKFRIYNEFDGDHLLENIAADIRIQPPSEQEISNFLEIFSQELQKSEILRHLNNEHNYKEEIFNIPGKISKIISEKFDLLIAVVNDLKAVLSQSQIEATLVEEWSTQLDEIASHLEAFLPQTALSRLEKLEQRILKKNLALGGPFEGQLTYLKASCRSELSFNEVTKAQSPLYIKAAQLCSENIEFQVQAAFSYYVIEDFLKASAMAEKILQREEYNVGAWLTKCFVSGNDVFSFLETLPKIVRDNRVFKAHLTHWLFAKQMVPEFPEIENLGLNPNITLDQIPEKITYKNKGLWILNVNYWLQKLYYLYPSIGSTGPSPEIFTDENFLILHSVLEKIVKAFEGTELENKYSWHKFQYLYQCFIKLNDTKQISEIRGAYDKIVNPSYPDVIQMVQVYNATRTPQDKRHAINVIESFGEDKDEILLLFNSFNYLDLKDWENSCRVFEKYIRVSTPIKQRTFCNILEYLPQLRKTHPVKMQELIEIILKSDFESKELKELYIMLHPSEELTNKTDPSEIKNRLDALAAATPDTNENLRYYVALALYSWGYIDDAVAYLKGNFDKSKITPELMIYCKGLYYGKGDKVELLQILEETRKNGHRYHELFLFEIILRLNLKDMDAVREVCEHALTLFPGDEKFLYNLFYALDENSDTEGIWKNAPLLSGMKFQEDSYAIHISTFLQRAQLFEQAIEMLYQTTHSATNKVTKQSFLHMSANYPKEFFAGLPKVEVGTFVQYQYKEKTYTTYVDSSNSETNPIKTMLGKAPGDTFTFSLPLSQVLTNGKVIKVMNKYSALITEIITEAEDPAMGYVMKSINTEGDLTPDKLREKLIAEFGYEGTKNRESAEEFFSQYANASISFSELANANFEKNQLDTYSYLTSHGKLFRAIPTTINFPVITDDTRFVIDFTSLSLFFELDKILGIKPKDKFVISGYVKSSVKKMLKEVKMMPDTGLRVEITLEGVRNYPYDKSFIEHRLSFLNNLFSWIEENCEIDRVSEKLNLLEDQTSEVARDEYMMFLADNRLLADRPNYILLTNDIIYYKQFKGNSNDIVSPELYLKSRFPEKRSDTMQFMVERNYVGVNINKDLLQEQFMKMAAGKDNKFSICLENLVQNWNPNNSHIFASVQFLKWLYLTSFINVDVRKNTAFAVFFHLLKGSNPEQRKLLKDSVDKEFVLLGSNFDEIRTTLLDALKSLRK